MLRSSKRFVFIQRHSRRYIQSKHQFTNEIITHYINNLSKLNNKPEELQKKLLKIQELSESDIYKSPSREAYIDAKKHTINNLIGNSWFQRFSHQ